MLRSVLLGGGLGAMLGLLLGVGGYGLSLTVVPDRAARFAEWRLRHLGASCDPAEAVANPRPDDSGRVCVALPAQPIAAGETITLADLTGRRLPSDLVYADIVWSPAGRVTRVALLPDEPVRSERLVAAP